MQDFCIFTIRQDLPHWASATDDQLRTLLQLGTLYPYGDRGDSFQDTIHKWVDYLNRYHTQSNGDIEVALKLGQQDRDKRQADFNQWLQDNQQQVKDMLAQVEKRYQTPVS